MDVENLDSSNDYKLRLEKPPLVPRPESKETVDRQNSINTLMVLGTHGQNNSSAAILDTLANKGDEPEGDDQDLLPD